MNETLLVFDGTLLVFIIGALATYRVTKFITSDYLFSPIRDFIWKKYPPEKSRLGYFLTCNWCASIWAASLVYSMCIVIPKIALPVGTVLAFSAVAGFLAAREDA